MSGTGRRELLVAWRDVVEAEIDRLAGLIGVRGADVLSIDPHVDGAHPYLEITDDGLLRWRVKERGRLIEDRSTRDPDEFLYWAFVEATWAVASTCEVQHRQEGTDPRVAVWAGQAELLTRLDPVWAQRWRRELGARQPHDIGLMPVLPSATNVGPGLHARTSGT